MNAEQKTQRVTDFLKVVAHPVRLRILILLSQQTPLSMSTLMTSLATSQPLLSMHLIKMRDKNIVVGVRKGKEMYYSVSDPGLAGIVVDSLEGLATLY